ncbi:MAG: nucleotidyltransferase domain-containing protein [Spirochaetales bacterium]|nr:nucleotidyltransferase domain-containing protein [Spirochaetales bacterium]
MSGNFGLSEEIVESLKSVFLLYEEIEKVVIYGSRAMGNYREGSDIDITLIGDDLDWRELVALENKLDDLMLPYELDISTFDELENPDLLEHINRVGKILFQR